MGVVWNLTSCEVSSVKNTSKEKNFSMEKFHKTHRHSSTLWIEFHGGIKLQTWCNLVLPCWATKAKISPGCSLFQRESCYRLRCHWKSLKCSKWNHTYCPFLSTYNVFFFMSIAECLLWKDGEPNIIARMWRQHPVGLRFICTALYSGWTKF